MGCSGEIYNILGVKFPVTEIVRREEYALNGVLIKPEEPICEGDSFLNDGIYTPNLANPKLSISLLGLTECNCDVSEALVGYSLANESYEASAQKLPTAKEIEALKPYLVKNIKKTFGLDVELSDLEVFLLFDFSQ